MWGPPRQPNGLHSQDLSCLLGGGPLAGSLGVGQGGNQVMGMEPP